jgi:hypothetical protein
MVFDAGGQTLAACSLFGPRLLDVRSGKEKPLALPRLHPPMSRLGGGQSVAFLAGDLLVMSTMEGSGCRVRLCSARDGRLLHQVRLAGPLPWCFAVAPDGRTLAAESAGGALHLLRLPTLEMIGKPQPTPSGPLRFLVFGDGGHLLASALHDRDLVLWKAPELRRVCHLPCPGDLSQVACSGHGQHLALVSIGGLVTVYDLGLIRADLKKFGLDW